MWNVSEIRAYMKILLIQPPITVSKNEIFGVTPPLGLAYLASVAEQSGHNVKILDTIVEGYNNKFYEDGYTRIGLPWETIRREIEKFHPNLVGITCPYSLMDEEMKTIARIAKNVDPKVPVVVGGAHPSSMPEYVIRDPNVDLLIEGEGESTFADLIRKLDEGNSYLNLKGLWLKADGKIRKNTRRDFITNLDSIPFPAWHLLSIEKYIKIGQVHGGQKRKRYASMITSRGCPGRCAFCSIHNVWGYKWRPRSPENILEEIEKLVHEYKIQEIHFEDDNLTLSKDRFMKICDLIIKRNLDISWTTPNGVAVNTIDLELLEKMKKSGCYQLSLGIESGDPKVLKNIIHKPLSLQRVIKVIKWSKKIGMWTHGYFVIGFPGEASESIRRTINFAKETDLDSASFFIATPYPGTPLCSTVTSERLLESGFDLKKLRTMDATMDTEYFKAAELTEIQKRAYFEFMNHRIKKELIGGYFLTRVFHIRSLGDMAFLMQKIRRLVRLFR